MQAAAPSGWELCLVREDNDSWLSIRPLPGDFEVCLDRHGSSGQWRHVTHAEAVAELLALAPFNDGSRPAYHALLTIPVPPSVPVRR